MCLCEYLLVRNGERIDFYSRSKFQITVYYGTNYFHLKFQMFSLISGHYYTVSFSRTQLRRFHTELYKTFCRVT